MNRRLFLTTGASALALAPAASGAFAIIAPSAEVERRYLAACARDERERHRELRRAIEARLEGKDNDEAAKALAAARCPGCGCSLAAAE